MYRLHESSKGISGTSCFDNSNVIGFVGCASATAATTAAISTTTDDNNDNINNNINNISNNNNNNGSNIDISCDKEYELEILEFPFEKSSTYIINRNRNRKSSSKKPMTQLSHLKKATEKCVSLLSTSGNKEEFRQNIYCPFHENALTSKSPSGKFKPEKNIYICYSTQCPIRKDCNHKKNKNNVFSASGVINSIEFLSRLSSARKR